MSEDALSDPADKLILIVDDDDGQCEIMTHVATQEGFRSEYVQSGQEALSKVQEVSPDLILLDLMIPGMGGYEIARALQASGNGSIPVIIVSGRHMDRGNVDLIRQEPNVREFMEKPLRPMMLAKSLHSILKTRPARSTPR